MNPPIDDIVTPQKNEGFLHEKWVDIKNFEGFYQISNMGRVRSLNRYVKWRGKLKLVIGKILKSCKDKYGYLYVCLVKNKRRKQGVIHRLVAQHFIENPNNYPAVNHIDRNKFNNNIENLEWCSNQMNSFHYWKTNEKKIYPTTISTDHLLKSSKKLRKKLDESQVIKIREMYYSGKFTQGEIASEFGISRRYLGDIVNRKYWKHVP